MAREELETMAKYLMGEMFTICKLKFEKKKELNTQPDVFTTRHEKKSRREYISMLVTVLSGC